MRQGGAQIGLPRGVDKGEAAGGREEGGHKEGYAGEGGNEEVEAIAKSPARHAPRENEGKERQGRQGWKAKKPSVGTRERQRRRQDGSKQV